MKALKIASVILIIIFGGLSASAQTSEFSYQGRLSEAGSPVTGTRFFHFTLFDEAGAAIPGATVEQTLAVTNGVFNTSLDFGANNFPGADRSLQIEVKINAGDAYTALNPRQEILAAPYAIKSKSADDAAKLGGVDSSRFVQQDAGGNVSIAGNFTVNGALSLNTVNAQMQYNLGGQHIVGVGAAGSGNFYAGTGAGQSNTSGILNTFVGTIAGQKNTTGSANSFFGFNAGLENTTGQHNSFFGTATGRQNNGSDNSFFGFDSGASNQTGEGNSFFGSQAGLGGTAGVNNSFFGLNAGRVISGGGNTFVGAETGLGNNTGNDNTLAGANANVGATSLTNAAAFGANATVTQNDSLVLGNNASVGIGTNAPKAKLDVTGGNILVGSPGQGIVLKSPDGATCKLLSIDNAGVMVLAAIACP